ncbi:MAG: ABC transporter ATP-binding protein [Snowella sp.]|nr:ABC transporter ATP-binding protein [Snowella sp.]
MSDTIIQVENLSKKYIISHQTQEKYTALRDVLTRGTKSFLKSIYHPKFNKNTYEQKKEEFWALDHISFEIKQGEVIGIIGRNGAGKSTLLKILSRITEPTQGQIKINGRVASLLEVGTGFHPELTGRENIFLNGAILGMSKLEIKRKFDEIVDFAEIEKFLDTPVKHYSSGMYVRLAFAVAAHLEPEILIVDEVLAVGDAAFQKKCLGKMESVSTKEGRTVLFVSHNMSATSSLCTHGIILKNGRVVQPKIAINKAVDYYLKSVLDKLSRTDNFLEREDRCGTGKLRFTGLSFFDENDYPIPAPICGQTVKIKLDYIADNYLNDVASSISFNSLHGENKILLRSDLVGVTYNSLYQQGSFYCLINKFPLSPGTYSVNCQAENIKVSEVLDFLVQACIVEVQTGNYFHTGKLPYCDLLSVCVEQQWQ